VQIHLIFNVYTFVNLFPVFPGISLTTLEFPDFQVFQVSGHPALMDLNQLSFVISNHTTWKFL